VPDTATPVTSNGSLTEEQERRFDLLRDAVLPVDTLKEAFPHLRRPFSPAAVKWKVQNDWTTGAVIIAYIDARLVIERLNAVCPTFWEPRFEQIGDNLMVCHLTLDDSTRKITRSDVGAGQGRTADDRAKAMRSDSLKRAGVHYGVGVPVYSMKAVTLNVGEGDGELRTVRRERKQRDGSKRQETVPILDRRTERWLSEMYEAWLAKRGIAMFGPILDHGDEFGATGMEDLNLPEAQGRDTMGDGDGDGEEPGWGDKLTPEQIGMLEHVIALARIAGHAALGDRAATQVEFADHPENVKEWCDEATREIDEYVIRKQEMARREKTFELAKQEALIQVVEEAWSAGPEEMNKLGLKLFSQAEGKRENVTPDLVNPSDPGEQLETLALLLHEEAQARTAKGA
jgi:hypothetical protein